MLWNGVVFVNVIIKVCGCVGCVFHVYYIVCNMCLCRRSYQVTDGKIHGGGGGPHIWAFRGDGGKLPQYLSLTFDPWNNHTHTHTHGVAREHIRRSSENKRSWTAEPIHHQCWWAFFEDFCSYFFMPISSISAPQHQGEIQGCSERERERDVPSQRLCLIYSPRLPPAYLSVLGWNCHSPVILWVLLGGGLTHEHSPWEMAVCVFVLVFGSGMSKQ